MNRQYDTTTGASTSRWLIAIIALLPASLLAQTNGQLYYFHNDHLGTPQAITDQNRQVVWQADQAPFGEQTVTINAIGNNLRFPGQYFDSETGLHYNYFRDYNPATGRYIQSDPIGLDGGLNTYAYVGANPLTRSDPLGLFCTSNGGLTTCVFPSGPAFTLPTPIGFPQTLGSDDAWYHIYNVTRALNGADPDCVFTGLVNNPTPGSPSSASPTGTINNAQVAGLDNYVRSYLTYDLNTNAPLVVNMAGVGDGSLFGPGYVVRYVQNGVAHSAGEGANLLQSPRVTGQALQNLANEALWGSQMNQIISNANAPCECH